MHNNKSKIVFIMFFVLMHFISLPAAFSNSNNLVLSPSPQWFYKANLKIDTLSKSPQGGFYFTDYEYGNHRDRLQHIYALDPSGKLKWTKEMPLGHKFEINPLLNGNVYLIDAWSEPRIILIDANGNVISSFHPSDFVPDFRITDYIINQGVLYLKDTHCIMALNDMAIKKWAIYSNDYSVSKFLKIKTDNNILYALAPTSLIALNADGTRRWILNFEDPITYGSHYGLYLTKNKIYVYHDNLLTVIDKNGHLIDRRTLCQNYKSRNVTALHIAKLLSNDGIIYGIAAQNFNGVCLFAIDENVQQKWETFNNFGYETYDTFYLEKEKDNIYFTLYGNRRINKDNDHIFIFNADNGTLKQEIKFNKLDIAQFKVTDEYFFISGFQVSDMSLYIMKKNGDLYYYDKFMNNTNGFILDKKANTLYYPTSGPDKSQHGIVALRYGS